MLDRQCLVPSPVLLCKTGWQQLFVTTMTPIDICFHTSLERETTKELQQCWTDSAWSLPLCCSAKQAGNSFLSLQRHLIFVFTQAWIGKPLKSCSSAGQSVLGLFPCAALQNRLTTAFCHCRDIYWYLPFTQAWMRETTKELQQCWTDSAWSLPLCCSAKQADNSFLSMQ